MGLSSPSRPSAPLHSRSVALRLGLGMDYDVLSEFAIKQFADLPWLPSQSSDTFVGEYFGGRNALRTWMSKVLRRATSRASGCPSAPGGGVAAIN